MDRFSDGGFLHAQQEDLLTFSYASRYVDHSRAVTGLSLTMATSSSSNDSVDKLDDLDGRNIDDLNDENIINNDDRFEKFDRR